MSTFPKIPTNDIILEEIEFFNNHAKQDMNGHCQHSANTFLSDTLSVEELLEAKSMQITAFLASPEIAKATQRFGEDKLKQSFWNVLISAILAGIFVNFGSMFSQRLGAQLSHTLNYSDKTYITEEGFGFQLAAISAAFPAGIILSILTGTQYFTANLFLFPSVLLHRKATIQNVFKFQFLCLIGNIIGALIFTWTVGYWTINLEEEGLEIFIAKFAEERMKQGFGTQLIKGIGFAWLISQAMLVFLSASSIFSKIFGLWLPLFGLACMGYEDIITNIYYITSGMMCNANITFGDYIGYSFLPQLLGHLISSNLFVGLYYCYLYNWPSKDKK